MFKIRFLFFSSLMFILIFSATSTFGKNIPSVIKIGTLYASTGPFAKASESQFKGLKFWVHNVNSKGGVFVKAFKKKIPIKLIAYNDQSSTATAAAMYNQLITQDHANILVADFGSVLTSVAVPLAKEHRRLLFDVTGTGAKFFTPDNPYVVLTSLPTSGRWPYTLADFIIKHKINKIAIIYSSNDFDQSQAITLHNKLRKAGINIVYYNAVPSSTSNYAVLLHSIKAKNPNAVIEFGYPNNDIAFLQNLGSSGLKFNMVFTVFPGQLFKLLKSNVGEQGLAYTYTYPTPPLLRYNKVNLGVGIDEFEHAFKAYSGQSPNFLNVAGYNVGLIIKKTLETANRYNQLSFRKAISKFSGKVFTLNGLFMVNKKGAQIGEMLPIAQFVMKNSKLKMNIVYPEKMQTANAVYPAP